MPTQSAATLINAVSGGTEGWRKEKKAQTKLDLKPGLFTLV